MLNDCLPLLGIASTCSRLRRGANRDGRAPVDRCEPRQPAEEIAGGRPPTRPCRREIWRYGLVP